MARLLIWHGYLLGGTGSNIYSANVARAWRAAGHEVVLMCQEPHPAASPFVDEVVDLRGSELLQVEPTGATASPAGGFCRVVRADIGALLPVYLLDNYERFSEVKRFVDCDESELARYTEAYQSALESVLERWPVDGAVLNHVVMGPPVLRPVFDAAGVPYSVKIHGSELEYCIAEDSRFVAPAQEGLAGAVRVLAGSDHIERRTRELLGDACVEGRIEIVPPGVDLDLFVPARDAAHRAQLQRELVDEVARQADRRAGRPASAAGLLDQAVVDDVDPIAALARVEDTYDERGTELPAAAALEDLDLSGETPVVTYVGKLIRQKGVHLVIAAWPLVLARVPDARLVLVGFGKLRESLGALVRALSTNDRPLLDLLIDRGFELDGPSEPMRHLVQFFDDLTDARDTNEYYDSADGMESNVTFVGQVDHAVLSRLWPLSTVSLVPSINPEAFGMVAAEAAACGSPPLVTYHSGLADVADRIAGNYPEDLRHLASFASESSTAIPDLADRIVELITLAPDQHARLCEASREAVVANWSWDSIAQRIADPLLGTPAR